LLDVVKLPIEIDLTVEDLKNESDDHIVIDVRPKHHFEIVSIENSVNFPLEALKKDPSTCLDLIKSHKNAYIICRWGNASRRATDLLLKKGACNIFNVRGGITEWIEKIDPSLPMY